MILIGTNSTFFILGWIDSLRTQSIVRNSLFEQNIFILAILSPLLIALFFLPSILALNKNIKNKNIILFINFITPIICLIILLFPPDDFNPYNFIRLLGFPWFICLITVLTSKKENETKDNKESIKISDNDSVIKSDIDTVIRKNSADLSIIKKIEELNRLKEDKILTEEEFSKLKNKLIDG
jgi:hypothetical protein